MDQPGRKEKPPVLGKQQISDLLRGIIFCGDILFFVTVQILIFFVRLQTHLFDWMLPESSFLWTGSDGVTLYWKHLALGTMLYLAIGTRFGIYSKRSYLRPRLVLADLFKSLVAWVLCYLLFSLFFKIDPSISRSFVILSGVTAFVVLSAWRLSFNEFLGRYGIIRVVRDQVLAIGWNDDVNALWSQVKNVDLREIGFGGVLLPYGGVFEKSPPSTLPVLGNCSELEEVLSKHHFDAVLLSDAKMPADQVSKLMQICYRQLVRFMVIPTFFEVLVSGLHVESIRGTHVLTIGGLPLERFASRATKRMADLILGMIGLILSAPIIWIFMILVKRESPGPALYKQTRVGRHGRHFRINKIRSMHPDAEAEGKAGWSLPDDDRRLKIGTFMRRWNIDELPQFWNVLKGEMSLVGPRPERPEFTADFKYSINYYNIRLTVKPGMTGWAAVNGLRGNTDIQERLRLDLDYIERWSHLLDAYIILLTLVRYRNAY
jgi:exopolysaccharide biosynthesis polyprenyl glycosylphosphotransferase